MYLFPTLRLIRLALGIPYPVADFLKPKEGVIQLQWRTRLSRSRISMSFPQIQYIKYIGQNSGVQEVQAKLYNS